MPDMVNKSIYEKLQTVRTELKKMNLKKSGKHAQQGFHYYELADFLPQATDLFAKHGLCPVYYIYKQAVSNENSMDYDIVEMAILEINDFDNNKIVFKTPTAENIIWKNEYENGKPTGKQIVVAQNDIQNLGSKKTYIKRYLYMDALDLVEDDSVDSGKDVPVEPVAPKVKAAEKPKAVEKPIVVEDTKDIPMSVESKQLIIKTLTSAKLDVAQTMPIIAGKLGVSMQSILESHKDQILEIIKELTK